ncbi:MAG: hypothetical protein ACKOQ2_30555, partial [Dolichospermum sp.]
MAGFAPHPSDSAIWHVGVFLRDAVHQVVPDPPLMAPVVIAKKIDNSVAIFKTAPQQSDYELMWQDGSIKEKMRFLSVNSQIQQITLGNLLKKIIPKN